MELWDSHPFEMFQLYWGQFVEFYLGLPLLAQIFVIIGIFLIIALTLVVVYYVIKGVAYLVYYLFKGLYYLIKAIATGIYNLFKKLYEVISGKPQGNEQNEPIYKKELKPSQKRQKITKEIEVLEPERLRFCSECGSEISEKISSLLISRGNAYCERCGRRFIVNTVESEI